MNPDAQLLLTFDLDLHDGAVASDVLSMAVMALGATVEGSDYAEVEKILL